AASPKSVGTRIRLSVVMIALQRSREGQRSCHGSPDRTLRLGPEIVDDRAEHAIQCGKLLPAGDFCGAVKANQALPAAESTESVVFAACRRYTRPHGGSYRPCRR